MADSIARAVPGNALEECFFPRYETTTKRRGRRVSVARALFPGYLIAISPDPVALQAALARVPEFTRLLCADGVPVPLAEEEVQVIDSFTHPGHRDVPMSTAVKEGERAVVVEGPLAGHDTLIKSVDRHKCVAQVQMDFCGREVRILMGLAVLDAADGSDAQASKLRRKVGDAVQPG